MPSRLPEQDEQSPILFDRPSSLPQDVQWVRLGLPGMRDTLKQKTHGLVSYSGCELAHFLPSKTNQLSQRVHVTLTHPGIVMRWTRNTGKLGLGMRRCCAIQKLHSTGNAIESRARCLVVYGFYRHCGRVLARACRERVHGVEIVERSTLNQLALLPVAQPVPAGQVEPASHVEVFPSLSMPPSYPSLNRTYT